MRGSYGGPRSGQAPVSFLTSWLPLRLREIASYRAGRAERALIGKAADTLVLAYHNIRPAGAPEFGERSLHLDRRDFARQLDFLQRTHEVRPLTTIGTVADRPIAIITFDDGYAGALTVGLEELARRKLPATFFVVPGRLGGDAFWWDRLGEHYRGVPPADIRRRALEELEGDEAGVAPWARELGIDFTGPVPPWARTGIEDDLRRAAATPGITLAAHTWTHPNLAAVSRYRLVGELVRARDWMDAHFPGWPRWISFPYGRSNPEVEEVTNQSGYSGGVSIGDAARRYPPGAVGASWRMVRRLNVPAGGSFERFALTVSGAW